jgi:predicted nucleic acid-binding protein
MVLPRCTIDSSCVIALDHLDLVPNLTFLFSQVLVPKAVREDLFKRRMTKKRVQFLFGRYDFFMRCDAYDKASVDILLADQGRRDRGEAEAVMQASQEGATVIVDDRWGRKLAAQHSLDYRGTIWVLYRFYELKLMSSSDLRTAFAKLRRYGIWLPWKRVNAILLDLGEKPLEN